MRLLKTRVQDVYASSIHNTRTWLEDVTYWQDRPVLVTGGAGMIGGHLCSRLVDLGSAVTVIDDLSSGLKERVPRGIDRFVVASIVNESALAFAFENRPTIVFHLAALFANENSIQHPELDLEVNGLGTWRVFEAAARSNVERVVYTSSSCVSNLTEPTNLCTARPAPGARTPYQATKFLGEQYAQILSRRVSTVTLRLFNCYGPGDLTGRYRSVVPNLVDKALRNELLPIYGSGTDTRDYTYVEDVVDALLASASSSSISAGPYDVGTGVETSVMSLAVAIRRLCGSSSSIIKGSRRTWDNVQRRCAETDAAKNDFNWQANVSLETGLAATVAWYLDCTRVLEPVCDR